MVTDCLCPTPAHLLQYRLQSRFIEQQRHLNQFVDIHLAFQNLREQGRY